MTKQFIKEHLLNVKGDLRFTYLKKNYPEYSKEDIYKIYFDKSGFCDNGHKLTFISFIKGYKPCKKCEDLNGFYNLENLKKYSKDKMFEATHIRKIKEYHKLTVKDIYLWHNPKEYCPICKKENIFINQTGYAKSCSAKCGNTLERRKLSKEEKDIASEKRKKTCFAKYGVEYNLSLLDHKGSNNPMKKKETLEKKNKTMLARYGTIYPLQNKELLKKSRDTFKKNFVKNIFGKHYKRLHFKNIDDYNETFIKDNFIKDNHFDYLAFEEYFGTSANTSLSVMRYFGLWDEKISKPEQIVKSFLDESFIKTKKIIAPYELDFYSEELKFAIEVHGDYWHSDETGTDPDYHKLKADLCKSKNISLYQFFEGEIINKTEIIQSMINVKLFKANRIFARKCSIKEIESNECKEFFTKNHLEGYSKSNINIGLYYKDELVFAGTFSKPRIYEDYDFELIRFASTLNTVVVGGFSKILSFFENTYRPSSLITLANRRWSEGGIYLKNNFEKSYITSPDYMFYKKGEYFQRQIFQKNNFKELFDTYDESISTQENIKNNGFYTLYDAGNIVYIKNYKETTQ